jgi:predicted HTH domain antitoxin
MTEIVSTRIPNHMAKDLKEIEAEEKADRATVVRKLLAKAISEWKLEKALTLFREGKITLWKAAKISGLTLWEMIEIIKERKIPFSYTYEDFREDFEEALKEK